MSTSGGGGRGRLRAAWTLVLLTTLCAELTFTAVAVPFVWLLLPLLMLMYGAGVLLVREVAVRAGGGWSTLVLLGLAYQLAEDGLGLQALTSPRMYGAADWGLRALGLNWSYWASQVGVHVVFSVLVPVMLTGLLFPQHRERPFLRTGGLVGVGALAIVGVLGLRLVISADQDPGYVAPWGATAGFLAAIAVLALVALRHGDTPRPAAASTVPRPAVVGVSAGLATVVFLGLLIPPGLVNDAPLVQGRGALLAALVAAAIVGIGSGWAVLRWSAAPGWSDGHRVWLAGGILVGHTAFMAPASGTALVTAVVVIAAEVAALALLHRRVGDQERSSGWSKPR